MQPDIVGDLSRASWKYWLRKTVPANIAMPTNSEREGGEGDGAVAEQPQRDDRLARPGLDEHEEQRRAAPRRATIAYDLPRTQSKLSPANVTQISSSTRRGGDEERAERSRS